LNAIQTSQVGRHFLPGRIARVVRVEEEVVVSPPISCDSQFKLNVGVPGCNVEQAKAGPHDHVGDLVQVLLVGDPLVGKFEFEGKRFANALNGRL